MQIAIPRNWDVSLKLPLGLNDSTVGSALGVERVGIIRCLLQRTVASKKGIPEVARGFGAEKFELNKSYKVNVKAVTGVSLNGWRITYHFHSVYLRINHDFENVAFGC